MTQANQTISIEMFDLELEEVDFLCAFYFVFVFCFLTLGFEIVSSNHHASSLIS